MSNPLAAQWVKVERHLALFDRGEMPHPVPEPHLREQPCKGVVD